MKSRSLLVRILAAVLVAALQVVYLPLSAAPLAASLSGRVISGETRAPLVGVKVHVGDPRTSTIRSSTTTAEDGRFTLADLPPSTYQVAIQAGQGLYIVGSPVRLAPGETKNVQLAVKPHATGRLNQLEKGEDNQAAGDTSVWDNPLTATLIVLGIATGVGVLVDQATDDDESSPSSP